MPLYTHKDNKHDRLIMIHVPETAATSMMKALGRNKYRDERPLPKYSLPNVIRKLQGIDLPGIHVKGRDYKKVIGEQTWEDIFSFAFVRNLWYLMVSSYFLWLQIAPNSSKR